MRALILGLCAILLSAAPAFAQLYDGGDNRLTRQYGRWRGEAWRQVRQTIAPYGVGLYLANLLTDEQARHVRFVRDSSSGDPTPTRNAR